MNKFDFDNTCKYCGNSTLPSDNICPICKAEKEEAEKIENIIINDSDLHKLYKKQNRVSILKDISIFLTIISLLVLYMSIKNVAICPISIIAICAFVFFVIAIIITHTILLKSTNKIVKILKEKHGKELHPLCFVK